MTPRLAGTPVQRIVVLRALMLGDLLCAVPALRAVKAGFPGAQLTLVGLPWARTLAQRLACIDEVIELPGHPGLPEIESDVRALPDFLARVQSGRFDLALQMHGSGEITNPLVACFGARHSAGFASPRAWRPAADADLYAPWPERGHEIERLLALPDRLGLARCGTELEFPVTPADRAALAQAWPGFATMRPYVCVHAGAQLPSRRWDVRRFGQVADALSARGYTIVLTGAPAEAGLVRDLVACMRRPAVNLCGRTTLWTLGALIESAECVVCNDTGVSHVAAALRCPSVVVSCGADPARWAPLDPILHRVLAHPMPCRPCSHRDCPYGHGCAGAISAVHVLQRLPRLITA
jgi:ADP-heptose:LPS heptosyltransferase